MDVISSLRTYNTHVEVYDPWANPKEVQESYGVLSSKKCPNKKFDAIVLAVGHAEFLDLDLNLLKKPEAVVYDVKNILSKEDRDKSL
jgi:UDP-N-acetyl-D-galactosamine dehydrogenase